MFRKSLMEDIMKKCSKKYYHNSGENTMELCEYIRKKTEINNNECIYKINFSNLNLFS